MLIIYTDSWLDDDFRREIELQIEETGLDIPVMFLPFDAWTEVV